MLREFATSLSTTITIVVLWLRYERYDIRECRVFATRHREVVQAGRVVVKVEGIGRFGNRLTLCSVVCSSSCIYYLVNVC